LCKYPNNPWGFTTNKSVNADAFALEYANLHGVREIPFSIPGDRFFRQEVTRLVALHPLGFLRKMVHNFVRSLRGGVYTGELHFIAVSYERYSEIELLTRNIHKAPFFARDLPAREGMPLLVSFALRRICEPLFPLLLVLFLSNIFISLCSDEKILFGILLSIVCFTFAMVSLTLSESRFLNCIYPMILGGAFLAGGKLKVAACRIMS
jgi:hypothetical protein